MTGIIILAAGASLRLGRAKQRLAYKGTTLLKHAIDAATNAAIGPVVVVVGANEKEVLTDINKDEVLIVHNPAWKEGMASSIHAGITSLTSQYPDLKDVILMVCDQPFVDSTLLKTLVDTKRESNKPIVACSYKETIGVPALFDKSFFPELLSLTGDEGGKRVLLNNSEHIASVPFPGGSIDIDTESDYQSLNK